MKHEQSNVKPPKFIVELSGDIMARITVTDLDSITEVTDADGNVMYEYKQYQTNKPYRANLAADVSERFEEWYALVKLEDGERAAAANRARRNALLRESDCEMTIDRMSLELPSGSTFSSWLVFLKKLGEAVVGSWAVYRQALRDLPQSPNWPYISESDWPQMPKKSH